MVGQIFDWDRTTRHPGKTLQVSYGIFRDQGVVNQVAGHESHADIATDVLTVGKPTIKQ